MPRSESTRLPEGRHEPVVYFARRRSDGAIKVGATSHISQRIPALGRVDLLAVAPGGVAGEGTLHALLAGCALDGQPSNQREWFAGAPVETLAAMYRDAYPDGFPFVSTRPRPENSARFPGPGGGSGSVPISEMGPRLRYTMTISPENAVWLNSQPEKRSAVVNRLIDCARNGSDSA